MGGGEQKEEQEGEGGDRRRGARQEGREQKERGVGGPECSATRGEERGRQRMEGKIMKRRRRRKGERSALARWFPTKQECQCLHSKIKAFFTLDTQTQIHL